MKVIKVKKPKGYTNFTDLNMRKDMKSSGYSVRVGRNPYSKKGEKVLYYKKKRKVRRVRKTILNFAKNL